MNDSDRIRTLAIAAVIALSALSIPGGSYAQYPSKPIKLISPSPPGGAPDTVARVVGEKLGSQLGQPVVVETRAGSGGNIAMDIVSRSAPDGYTLGICFDAMVVINPHMYDNMPLDTLKDLVPISSVAVSSTFFLVVNPSVPARNLQEFIDYAKKASPPLAFASGGNGSQHQLAMELLKVRAGINLLHVPYKGGAPATTAVIGGEIPTMFTGSVNIPQIRGGKLRVLAATGAKRSPVFPDVPTIGELYPGYLIATWMGLFSPVGLPDAVVSRLRSEIGRVLALADTKERLNTGSALDPYVSTPDEFAAVIRADHEKYGKLVRQIGLKAQ